MSSSRDVLAAHGRLLRSLGAVVHAVPTDHAAMAECGRLGPLPCWSLEGTPRETVALARTLARRGRIGLLLADDPATRRRTLVVSLPPCRPAVVDPFRTDQLPVTRLRRLSPTESLLGTATAVATALDVDAAGRRAFATLRTAIDEVTARLDQRLRQDTRHAWALLQVTRLLFLRFVEAEGWLDGRPDFLRRAIDDCLAAGRNPGRQMLAPLFFGMLNCPDHRRSRRVRSFGTIPFLNGGLFEPHQLERMHRWHLPAAGWLRLFELVIDHVEVTLDRDDPGERVTPELLGRVFEGVMDPRERRDGGAFYTPAPLVEAIMREAYASHLAPRLGRSADQVRDALTDPDPELRRALLATRVLDPAVGSGAFLVGALQIARGPGTTSPTVTRRLLTGNLFGVDRNPAAVRITELRLWLELLRTMRGTPTARVAPLPNLDTAVRAGDAVIDPLAGIRVSPETSRRLRTLRRAATTSHGPDRRQALAALRRVERQAMGEALARTEQRLGTAITELLDDAMAPQLFGEHRRLGRDARRRLRELRRAFQVVRAERRRLGRADAAPAFALESAFATELANGGFDLVVGNPPWVRAERLPTTVRTALASRYRWWRGTGAGWRHLPDLSVAFLERALDVTAPGGTVAMLVPGKLATAAYAGTCRAALAHRTTMHIVADLSHDPRAGFEATTYPMAVIASRCPPSPDHLVRRVLGAPSPTTPQQLWRERGCWSLAPGPVVALAERLRARHPPLSTGHLPSLGIKTGANRIFLDPPPELRPWTRPVIRGRDIASARRELSRILWPADHRGEPWSELPPAVAAQLQPHRAVLERRRDLTVGPWWRLFRTGAATARWRVIWADIARTLHPITLTAPEPVPLNSCYVIATRTLAEASALGAWLGSAPIRGLAALEAEPASGGFRRFGARAVGAVPLPEDLLVDPSWAELVGGGADAAARDRWVAGRLGIGEPEVELLGALDTPGG